LYELLLIAAASDKVYQLLAHGRWFSPGTPASSTTKTGRHDLAEILLKLVLSTINKSINQSSVIDAYFYLQVCLH
jgi:broad specificity polyphosphatase/5'/3'-nucleotidase SurE